MGRRKIPGCNLGHTLEARDPLLEGRVGSKECHQACLSSGRDLERLERGFICVRIADLFHSLEGLKGGNHLVIACQVGASPVGSELAEAGEGADDDRAEDHEDHFKEKNKHHVAEVGSGGTLVAADRKSVV